MKKLLLFIALAGLMLSSFAQTDLFFSEYIEGSGNNKALEIYNPTTETIDLSNYIVVRFSNGEAYPANLNPKTTSGGYCTLIGNLAPGACHVLVNGQTEDNSSSPACDPALQALADQLDVVYPAPTYMNGNDAIGLLKTEDNGATWVPVDIFGQIGLGSAIKSEYGWSYVKDSVLTYKDGDTQVTATIKNFITPANADNGTSFGPYWMAWSKDHSLIRKPNVKQGVTSNPSIFDISLEWDTLPAVNHGDTAWSYQDIWTNLGTHTITTGISENATTHANIDLYPNPIQNNRFTIKTDNNSIQTIEIVNIIGSVVYKDSELNSQKEEIQLENIAKGVYMVKITLDNNSIEIKKIIIE